MTTGENLVRERAEERVDGGGDAAPSVEELLTLHGQPVLDYAALCTGPSPGAAQRLAGQAFRNTYGDAASHAGSGFPWRPRLLAAVLAAARQWSTGDNRPLLHPELRDGGTHKGRRAAAPAITYGTGDRSLVLHAFRSLPDRTQALLWHTEVEAEDIEAVASLLGAEPSLLNSERARTLLRDECVRAHLDLAPREQCRRLNRLIDVHAGPGAGGMMAEVLEHLDGCGHCRAAVDELDQSPHRLPALLAEAVLGFRAADYLTTRPARRTAASAHARAEPEPGPVDAEAEPTTAAAPAPRPRRRWPLLVGMGVVLCGVIAATPMALSGTEVVLDRAGGPTPGLTPLPSDSLPVSSADPQPPDASTAPGASEALATRLHNTRTGLCLDVAGSAQMAGALAVTARCGGSATQLWRLEDGGRLRNQAAPDLCLNAEPAGSLALRPCADPSDSSDSSDSDGPDGGQSGDTRYDLAADGLLTLVAKPGVAVTPGRRSVGSIIFLEPVPQDRVRRSQRWSTDEASDGATSLSQSVRDTSAAAG
ncbi:ricin-type beta-trefoil lectin domain protein [Streptomyces adelaidensis]|uniref:ricin-type beta-trefoil lectin domain protein n=1 Tax=Streptomyces adelaidensis TaxID=2796465 RepID=UPI001F161061|nr:ricin-type beta-trefoil lectin domain protein [Streptomyces adelaidensis]